MSVPAGYAPHTTLEKQKPSQYPLYLQEASGELIISQHQKGYGGEHKAKQYAGLKTSSLRVSCTAPGILQHGITARASPPGVTADEVDKRRLPVISTLASSCRSTKAQITCRSQVTSDSLLQIPCPEIHNIRDLCWVAEPILVEFKFSQYLRI